MDNIKTHSAAAFYETFEPEEARRLCERYEFVYTPKHGSWLNMAEIELHVLNRQCLARHINTMQKITEEVKVSRVLILLSGPTRPEALLRRPACCLPKRI